MSATDPRIEREDVLNAFAVESDFGPETLTRYLHIYPQFARELIDLRRELAREACEDQAPLSERDREMIDSAWQRHAAASTTSARADPFAALSTPQLRDAARQINVPRQVLTAIRERRVLIETVPRRFLRQLAEAIHSTLDDLTALLSAPSGQTLARSFRANTKPAATAAVSFEQILIEAGVSYERRAALLQEGD